MVERLQVEQKFFASVAGVMPEGQVWLTGSEIDTKSSLPFLQRNREEQGGREDNSEGKHWEGGYCAIETQREMD